MSEHTSISNDQEARGPEFDLEQEHLTATYGKLESIAATLADKLERRRIDAAKTKEEMQGEVKHNFASDG